MTSNGKTSREDTRTALLNGFIRKNEVFTTEDGILIEVQQPTVGQRGRMLKRGGLDGTGAIDDFAGMQIAAVIECCYHPGSGKKIFEWTDEEVIENLPTSSWFDEVAGIAMDLMNAKPADAGKPSAETVSDSASSTLPASSEEPLQNLSPSLA